MILVIKYIFIILHPYEYDDECGRPLVVRIRRLCGGGITCRKTDGVRLSGGGGVGLGESASARPRRCMRGTASACPAIVAIVFGGVVGEYSRVNLHVQFIDP